RKAHLLEDNYIPSVGVFDEVILEAFREHTLDLDSIWEEMVLDCNFTRSGLKNRHTVPGDGVAIPSDAVRTYKGQHRELCEGVRIVYNRRTKKVMETMNVTVDELSTIAFEQRSLKLELQGRTSGHISLGLDLTYASSTITSQKPTERDLELLFETMYDDYMGGQLLDATRTAPAAPATMNLQSLNASTTTAENVLIPTNSSIEAPAIPKTSHDDNAHDGMFDKDMFIHPFAQPSTSSAKSSLQYVDPS
ncbi:hypothetical protein Tco_0815039, partial [Tanacetum coccineum]